MPLYFGVRPLKQRPRRQQLLFLLSLPLQDTGAHADMGPFTNNHPTAKACAGSNMPVVANNTVVFNNSPCVYNHVFSYFCPGIDDCSRQNCRSFLFLNQLFFWYCYCLLITILEFLYFVSFDVITFLTL